MKTARYEYDGEAFPHDAYRVRGYSGVAFTILGWEMEEDEDTEWTGMLARSGKVIGVMVGDDSEYTIDPEDISPLSDEEYCGGCGQIGCGHSSNV